MNRYVLIPEDTLRILPPEDGAGAAIEIFCSRTVIYFEIAQLREVCLLHHVRADRELVDALCFTAADRLLEQPQKVLIPTNRPDYAAFLADLRHYAPPTLDFSKEADDIAPSCDHNGTNPCRQGFLSSVLVSSFPNRKLNLRFGFFHANLQQQSLSQLR